jgi:riboflavin kinase/FMN adenylyltransferase
MQASLDEALPQRQTVIGLGTFDGLHLGHRMLLGRVRALAEQMSIESAVLTFPQPPRNYLGQGKRLILPPDRKLRLLEEEVELVIVADFPELQPLPPEQFVRILKDRLKAVAVVVGEDYRFGQGRRGDAAHLRQLGRRLGFRVDVLTKLLIDGEPVSSTSVRRAIEAGEIEQARRLLGYPPLLLGPVIQGEERGKKLGFPTANLKIQQELITPGDGVFAVQVKVEGRLEQGLLYIGRRPTFNGGERSFEVYILGFTGELYGKELGVYLLSKMRGDLEFRDPVKLQRQIDHDVKAAQEFFAAGRAGEPR